MSKYAPIEQRLAATEDDSVFLSFSEMETLLGFPLPSSAYNHRAWWSNGKKGGSKFWLRVGWLVDAVALGQSVTFRRSNQPLEGPSQGGGETCDVCEPCDHGVMVNLDVADIPSIIKDLRALMIDGIISRDEFEEKKANLLAWI